MGRKFPGYEQGLKPEFKFLSDKAVIVQAWKKAHEYIRRHNWYSDTLDLDVSCIELDALYEEIHSLFSAERYKRYRPDPMRVIPAPKSCSGWTIEDGQFVCDEEKLSLRPLAHLTIKDQTISMLFLMCLANIIENRQGRPIRYGTHSINSAVSYGNRLLCSWDFDESQSDICGTFLWGNAETYDRYYLDYQAFISRPGDFLSEYCKSAPEENAYYTVTVDLSRCYDRIIRKELLAKIRQECANAKIDEDFFTALAKSFGWRWDACDAELLNSYQEQLNELAPNDDGWIRGATGIPQGLVAGGFYANIYLLQLDDRFRELIRSGRSARIADTDVVILDYCRYVDDMRIVVSCNHKVWDCKGFKDAFCKWIQQLLDELAKGQVVNSEKVAVIEYVGSNARSFAEEQIAEIKNCASGPMDAKSAWELLKLNRSLWPADNACRDEDPIVVGDMVVSGVMSKIKDDTLERFVASNWRRAYNRLSSFLLDNSQNEKSRCVVDRNFSLRILNRQTDVFCDQIFRRWTRDPSKIRILRIAFDMRPDAKKAKAVIQLAMGLVRQGGVRQAYGYYILSELFRAGVTETGFSRKRIDQIKQVDRYRKVLLAGLADIVSGSKNLPWYLAHQLIMFGVLFESSEALDSVVGQASLPYRMLAAICKKTQVDLHAKVEFGPELLLAYLIKRDVGLLRPFSADIIKWMTHAEARRKCRLLAFIRSEDMEKIWEWSNAKENHTSIAYLVNKTYYNLKDIVCSDNNPFTDEIAVLRLAVALCIYLQRQPICKDGCVSPDNLEVCVSNWRKIHDATVDVRVVVRKSKRRSHQNDYLFASEEWEPREFVKVAQVGRIIRSVVSGGGEYSRMFSSSLGVFLSDDNVRTNRYAGVRSSALKRRYGLYFDRMAMGGPSVPYSPWLTSLLSSLLSWPGAWCDVRFEGIDFKGLRKECISRLHELKRCNQKGADYRIIPVDIDLKRFNDGEVTDELNVAVVQNIYPKWNDFRNDIAITSPDRRSLAEEHLADLIQMLMQNFTVRGRIIKKFKSVNLVVFPEISVLPSDVKVLERFADHMNCMVFCGLVFPEHPHNNGKRINAGLWIIPQRSVNGVGDRRVFVELLQGKQNLTADEIDAGIEPFRPVQWLVRGVREDELLWTLTASICYDATDIALLSALRDQVDCTIVASSNKDTAVYDSMAEAMRFHMYGHVVIANSGEFGGSTIQAPYRNDYERVIVHSHGQDQAVVSMATLHLNDFSKKRLRPKSTVKSRDPKTSPAGYKGRQ